MFVSLYMPSTLRLTRDTLGMNVVSWRYRISARYDVARARCVSFVDNYEYIRIGYRDTDVLRQSPHRFLWTGVDPACHAEVCTVVCVPANMAEMSFTATEHYLEAIDQRAMKC